MDAVDDSDLKWEPVDDLADNESDWESDDEVESTDHSDSEMDEDMVSSDGSEASTDGGTSGSEIPNKKARQDVVSAEEETVTDCGNAGSEPANKKFKKDTTEVIVIDDGDGTTDDATNKSASSAKEARKTKKTTFTQLPDLEAVSCDDGNVSDCLWISSPTRKNKRTTNSSRPTTSRKKARKTKKKGFTTTKLDPTDIVGDYWRPEETALLLASIKQYGMLNVEHLASIIETKNVRQIRNYIIRVSKSVYLENRNAAKRRATQRLAKQNEGKRHTSVDRRKAQENKARAYRKLLTQEMGEGPIEWWLRYMEDAMTEMSKLVKTRDKANNPRTVSEMIPRACLLISQYEDHPHPRLCGGVDYEEAYDCLYHVLSGVPPKMMSPPTAMFIQRSIDRLRNSILVGMYSPEYCRFFGEQVSHVQSTSEQTKLPPQRTYGAPSKKAGPVMTPGCGLPTTLQSLTRLMDTLGFNPMKVPESLTWRNGHTPPSMDKPVVKQKRIIRKDVPFGVFCDMDIYEGLGPSRTTK